jgi:hypothetical protein
MWILFFKEDTQSCGYANTKISMEAMFRSSLPQVVCRRTGVFCFVCLFVVSNILLLVFCVVCFGCVSPMSCVLCPVSCVLCPVCCVLCPVSCVLCPMFCVLCPVSYVLCSVSCVLCARWCQFLWMVHYWLRFRVLLTFIISTNTTLSLTALCVNSLIN